MESFMRDRIGRETRGFVARRPGVRESGLGSRVVLEENWRGDQVLVRRKVRPSLSRRRRRFDIAAGMTLLGVVMTGGAAASYAVATWIAS
jgi:hypothetical protein